MTGPLNIINYHILNARDCPRVRKSAEIKARHEPGQTKSDSDRYKVICAECDSSPRPETGVRMA